MNRLCVFNGRLVTSSGIRRGGVLVGADGRIEAVLEGPKRASAETAIDARERLVFAGFVDAHVHMRDPGYTHKEDFASGSIAAACGGVTTVMCMPNTRPAVDDMNGLKAARAAGEDRSYVDFTLQAAITRANAEVRPSLWAAGITSFEAGTSEAPDDERLDDLALLRDVFTQVAALGATIGVFAGCQPLVARDAAAFKEAGRTDAHAFAEARDPLGEATGIATVLEFAAATGARLVLRQVCTTRGFEIVRQAKRGPLAGLIGVEVTPHNLHLDVGTYDRLGTFAQMLPPLRSPGDCAAAVEALSDGTVDFVGSDHAPHSPEEKAADSAWEAACGTPGLDTLAASVLDLARRGAIPYARVAEVLSERPAALFGLKDRKGTLGPGADGDLVLIDPEVVRTVTPEMIRSKAGRSPFEGTTLTGWPVLTVLRGEVVAEEGRIVASGPKGRFVDRGDDPAA